MGLKSMHAEKQSEQPQQSVQDNSLIEQQSQRIAELMKEQEQDSYLIEQQSQKIAELERHISQITQQSQKKDSQISEAISQAEEWKNQAEKSEIQIQKLLSEKQELVSTVAEQGKRIAEQTEQIEKLNEADNVLKLNAELKKQNEKLKQDKLNAEQEAEATVSSVKREYQQKVRELASEQSRVEQREREANSLKNSLQAKIKAEAELITQNKRKRLENEYKAITVGHEGIMMGSLLYGVLCTIFTAWNSETFVSDFKTFFISIWGFLCLCVEKLLEMAKWASQLGDMIPQPTVAVIAHWLILIAVILLAGGGVIFLLFLAGNYAYIHYRDNYADTTSLTVVLISLAVTVFFAEPIRAVVPINLLLLLIIAHVLYIGVRYCIKDYRKSMGYY